MEPNHTPCPPHRPSTLALLAAVIAMVGWAFFPSAGVAASRANAIPLLIPNDQTQITNGILALGIVLVVIVIVGVLLGSRGMAGKKPKTKKQKIK